MHNWRDGLWAVGCSLAFLYAFRTRSLWVALASGAFVLIYASQIVGEIESRRAPCRHGVRGAARSPDLCRACTRLNEERRLVMVRLENEARLRRNQPEDVRRLALERQEQEAQLRRNRPEDVRRLALERQEQEAQLQRTFEETERGRRQAAQQSLLLAEKAKFAESAADLSFLQAMNPILFEQWIALLFEHQGYSVRTTRASGDGGVDVIAQKPGETLSIQCKRYKKAVGVQEVRQLGGALHEFKNTKGVFVTTGTFTAEALRYAREASIRTIDGAQLPALLRASNLLPENIPSSFLGAIPDALKPKLLKPGAACPRCGKKLIRRRGAYGRFLGCSAYPACSFTESKLGKVKPRGG